MKCFLCAESNALPYMTAGVHVLERCSGCGLVYVANFSPDGVSYRGDDYFVRKNEYVRHWEEFCVHFERLLDKIERFKPQGVLLDVGAGVGILLHVAGRRGFITRGVEVSEWASAYARDERKLDVVAGTLEEAAFPDSHFDVIVINHVLEHVPDPLSLLREARRILKDDGVIVAGVPNIGSIMAGILRERWPSLRPEEHIWHFSPITLRRLIRKAGFREVHFEARDNHVASGWGPKAVARRVINGASVLADRSEAMLIIAKKKLSPGVPGNGMRRQQCGCPRDSVDG